MAYITSRKRILNIVVLLIFISNFQISKAQEINKNCVANYITDSIIVDGNINEIAWTQHAHTIDDYFTLNYPNDTARAPQKTDVKICYNDKYLFIAAKCYVNKSTDKFIVQSLRRDFENNGNDMFAVMLCPSGDKLNGFCFSVSPYNSQREGTIEEGGFMGVTTAWDTKWKSATKRHSGYYEVEIAIPFNVIRFQKNSNWLINFARNNFLDNEKSTLVRVRRNINIASLSNTLPLEFSHSKPHPKSNIAFIPFIINENQLLYANNKGKIVNKLTGGADIKIGLNKGLTLETTINPDFSQIEVDRQITNITRFAVALPEKRSFFLENGDLFARFGFSRIRPFFSRNIGLDNEANIIPIVYGLKLSGKINESVRIGAMNVQTNESKDAKVKGKNYLIAATQIQTNGRNNVGLLFINQQDNEGLQIQETFNRIAGIDYNINSLNNRTHGKIFYHQGFNNSRLAANNAQAVWLNYNNIKWDLMYNHEYVGKNYSAPVGFVMRKDIIRFEPSITRYFYPKSKTIFNHGIMLYTSYYLNTNWKKLDYIGTASYTINFINTSILKFSANNNYIKLTKDFDAAIKKSEYKYKAGEEFNFNNFQITYNSDFRKNVKFNTVLDYGGYFTGKKTTITQDITARIPPYISISANAELNIIDLPKPYNSATYLLLGSKLDITFTPTLYWSTFIQYNKQTNYFGVNSRIQWRFKPVSDLFIVYTDNYTSSYFKVNNRYLILKCTYWINN